VLILISILASAIVFLYVVILKSWDQFGRRSDVRAKIQFALEQTVRDVRNANQMSIASNQLRFKVGSTSYAYYLNNSIELRKVTLGDASHFNDAIASGSGDLVASGLTNATTLTSSGNIAQINLVGLDSNETLRVRGYARPRNV